jgi:hypothetical protein
MDSVGFVWVIVVDYRESVALYGILLTKQTLSSINMTLCPAYHASKWPEFHDRERMHTVHVIHA